MMCSQSRLFRSVQTAPWFYFAHSYYVPRHEAAAAVCSYETSFSAAIERGNTFGVQFHPEKSAAAGAELIAGFVNL